MSKHKAVVEAVTGVRYDASFSVFVDQQLEAMEATVYRTVYNDLKSRNYIVLKSDVPAGAQTFAYRLLDMFGRADFISPWSNEIPMVGLRGEKKVGKVETIADAYAVSKQDLLAAQMNGFPLDTELATAARRAIDERENSATLQGYPALGFAGFFNHPDITVLSATADWDSGATAGTVMLADLRRIVTTVVTQTKGRFIPTDVVMPLSSFNVIVSKPVDTTGSVQDTVFTVFNRGSAYPVTVSWDTALETAGVGGTKRMMAFTKSPQVAQLVIPQEIEVSAPQYVDLTYKRILDERYGGLAMRLPMANCYLDGM